MSPPEQDIYARMAEAVNKEVEPLRALVRDLSEFQDHLFTFYCMALGDNDDEVEAQLNALIERSKALLGEMPRSEEAEERATNYKNDTIELRISDEGEGHHEVVYHDLFGYKRVSFYCAGSQAARTLYNGFREVVGIEED